MVNNKALCHTHFQFFEGVEKLLEIWFSPSSDEKADLRNIPRSYWEKLLKEVKCEIISFSRNESIDAYVLSESSMFISKHKWILKTCGTTTPLHCLKPLLHIARQHGLSEVKDLFYSRKNFARPELQLYPHRGFCEEVEFLDTIFPDGKSYCLGSINKECWYLYSFSNKNLNKSAVEDKAIDSEYTIEILMQNLKSNVMKTFSKETSHSARDATLFSGINQIFPNMVIDDYLFDPCGYSMNGIGNKEEYMTIHVTPENNFSYVSFESNVALDNYGSLINHIIEKFLPSKFMVTVFTNKTPRNHSSLLNLQVNNNDYNWKRTDMQFCTFPTYNLYFAQFSL